MADEKVKLQKLDNNGNPTDIVGEFDPKQAKAMLKFKKPHWREVEQKASPAKSDNKK